MTRHSASAILAALALGACVAPVHDVEMPTVPPENACGAAELAGLAGQDRKVLEAMELAGPLRVIEPGMPVTADFNARRLNAELDANGRIARLSCG